MTNMGTRRQALYPSIGLTQLRGPTKAALGAISSSMSPRFTMARILRRYIILLRDPWESVYSLLVGPFLFNPALDDLPCRILIVI